jgi:hypothetical protein
VAPTIISTTVLNGKVLFAIFAIGHNVPVTDFRLLPARNRSPFKYHCDHLDASLSVKNRVKISVRGIPIIKYFWVSQDYL